VGLLPAERGRQLMMSFRRSARENMIHCRLSGSVQLSGNLTHALLSQEPGKRPSAEDVLQQLTAMQEALLQQNPARSPQEAMATPGQSLQQVTDGNSRLLSSGCRCSTFPTVDDPTFNWQIQLALSTGK